ncbi:hypothetical protein [Bradyrhizobium guangdongense]|uniref:ATP dependent DNA ligase n=1 Tax=Bradyrhizobium guangdongense TaxID=1325090 RepID=UPI003D9A7924
MAQWQRLAQGAADRTEEIAGAGWSRTTSAQIRKARYRSKPEAKADEGHQEAKATWVEPKFYADIEYRDITSEGLLRASSFKGLRRNAPFIATFAFQNRENERDG